MIEVGQKKEIEKIRFYRVNYNFYRNVDLEDSRDISEKKKKKERERERERERKGGEKERRERERCVMLNCMRELGTNAL